MGLLSQLRENQKVIKPSQVTENKEAAATLYRRQLIEQGGRLFDETYSRYHGLGKLLESDDPRDQLKAAMTLNMLAKVENHIEGMKQTYGEGVVQTSLGALTPRVL